MLKVLKVYNYLSVISICGYCYIRAGLTYLCVKKYDRWHPSITTVHIPYIMLCYRATHNINTSSQACPQIACTVLYRNQYSVPIYQYHQYSLQKYVFYCDPVTGLMARAINRCFGIKHVIDHLKIIIISLECHPSHSHNTNNPTTKMLPSLSNQKKT